MKNWAFFLTKIKCGMDKSKVRKIRLGLHHCKSREESWLNQTEEVLLAFCIWPLDCVLFFSLYKCLFFLHENVIIYSVLWHGHFPDITCQWGASGISNRWMQDIHRLAIDAISSHADLLLLEGGQGLIPSVCTTAILVVLYSFLPSSLWIFEASLNNFLSSWRCRNVLLLPFSHCIESEISSGHASCYSRYVSLYEWDNTSKIGYAYHYHCC